MQIHLLAIGNRMPPWVEEGYREYAKRMPRECRLALTEIPAGRRTKGTNLERLKEQEGARLLAAVPRGSRLVALDVAGRQWSTKQLAEKVSEWTGAGRDTCLLVGGPEGLSQACLARAEQRWSLSALTLPHPLVRVVIAEQLYRAWTLLSGHPYHR